MSNLSLFDLGNETTLGLIKTDKFKSTLINIYFLRNIDREEVTKLSLLINLLSTGTKSMPTIKDVSKKLDELYGMDMDMNLLKYGEKLCTRFRFFSVADKYVGKEIFSDVIGFIRELLLNPVVEDGGINPKMIEVERENIREEIKSIINDKSVYARVKCIENMCKDEAYSISSMGYLEDLDEISPQDLLKTYEKLLSTSKIFITVEGDFDEDRVVEIVKSELKFPRESIQDIPREDFKKDVDEVKYIKEVVNTNQGKLVIGYRTNVDYFDEERYYALLVANSIFGGGPHSKLFRNVREKESLCYSISSDTEKNKGIMMVSAGIDPDNYEKTLGFIRKEFSDVKEGRFTDEEIKNSKKNIINNLKMAVDSNIGEADFTYNQYISGTNFTVEDVCQRVDKVSRETIIKSFENIKEDTVYFLR